MRDVKEGGRGLVLGITGSAGSGKTTVAALLAARGAVVVDADRLARGLLGPGTPEYYGVVKEFGWAGIVRADGAIDRRRLRNVVFADEGALRRLNAVMHPPLKRLVAAEVARLLGSGARLVVVDAAVLLESGMRELVDAVVLVTAPKQACVERLASRREAAMTADEAEQLLSAQARFEQERVEAADYVISNDGTREDLEFKVSELLKWCQRVHGDASVRLSSGQGEAGARE